MIDQPEEQPPVPYFPPADVPGVASGVEYFVSPTGTSSGSGSAASPFSLEYAFSGAGNTILPGDIVWIQEGTYLGKYDITVSGTKDKPIVFRAIDGARVILDSNGGVGKEKSYTIGLGTPDSLVADYIWIWGLEVTSSDENRYPGTKANGRGGIGVVRGEGIRIINCIVHDAAGGVDAWKSAKEIEIYGCLLFNNGWIEADRGHGHGNYMQSYKGNRKTFAESIMFNNFGNFGHHVYGGTSADLFDFTLAGNFHCDNGLLFGGNSSSVCRAGTIAICEEMTYRAGVIIGYWDSPNKDVLLKDNYFASNLSLKFWHKAFLTDNTFLADITIVPTKGIPLNDQIIAQGNLYPYRITIDGGQTYDLAGWQASGQDPTGKRAAKTNRVFIRPNRYEKGRAHIFVYNWEKHSSIALDLSLTGLKIKENFEIRNAFDYNGTPVYSGTYTGNISLEMREDYSYVKPLGSHTLTTADQDKYIRTHPGREFGAFVLVKK